MNHYRPILSPCQKGEHPPLHENLNRNKFDLHHRFKNEDRVNNVHYKSDCCVLKTVENGGRELKE
jgi:hypothetical protein